MATQSGGRYVVRDGKRELEQRTQPAAALTVDADKEALPQPRPQITTTTHVEDDHDADPQADHSGQD